MDWLRTARRGLLYVILLGCAASTARAEFFFFKHHTPLYCRSHYYHGQPPVFAPLEKPAWYPYGHFGAHPKHGTLEGVHSGYWGDSSQWRFHTGK